jgi:hypothetical protein
LTRTRPYCAHNARLRAIGLFDFVCLDLSASGVSRPDLVAELIATYSGSHERSDTSPTYL